MRRQFKDTMMDLAAQDDDLVLVFGDISVFLFRDFQEAHPERFFNLGICENTLVSVAAGLSAAGFVPFVHTIAPFLTDRSLEQIKLDLCYNQYGANIVTCGASFDYAWDGATHHAYTDLASLRLLPGMEVMQPGNREEADQLLRSQYRNGKTSYFRLSDYGHSASFPVRFGEGVVLKDLGAPVTVVTSGPLLRDVLVACEGLPVNLLYFHTIKPIDHALISRFKDTHLLIFQDAHGLQEAVMEVPELRVTTYGLPDAFCVWYGTVDDVRREIGLDPTGIRAKIQSQLEGAKV